MTARGDFDLVLGEWMAATAHVAEPEGLHDGVVAEIPSIRQRPAWLAGRAARGFGQGGRASARGLSLVAVVAAITIGGLVWSLMPGSVVPNPSASPPGVVPPSARVATRICSVEPDAAGRAHGVVRLALRLRDPPGQRTPDHGGPPLHVDGGLGERPRGRGPDDYAAGSGEAARDRRRGGRASLGPRRRRPDAAQRRARRVLTELESLANMGGRTRHGGRGRRQAGPLARASDRERNRHSCRLHRTWLTRSPSRS